MLEVIVSLMKCVFIDYLEEEEIRNERKQAISTLSLTRNNISIIRKNVGVLVDK